MKFADENNASVERGGRPCLPCQSALNLCRQWHYRTSPDLPSSKHAMADLRDLLHRRPRWLLSLEDVTIYVPMEMDDERS